MPIECEIIPPLNATCQDHRVLGEAIERWLESDMWSKNEGPRSGIVEWLDKAALQDLLGGEPPRPLIIRMIERLHLHNDSSNSREKNQEIIAVLRHDLGNNFNKSSVPFRLQESGFDRKNAIENLRIWIQPILVSDIIIDGVSWTS